MGYHLYDDEAVDQALRRIAIEQIGDARVAAVDPARRENAPHEMRKRCKKLRGLLRLVRGAFADYGTEQQLLRDAARALAAARESNAHLEALQQLRSRDADTFGSEDFERARQWLTEQRNRDRDSGSFDAAIADVDGMLAAQLGRVAGWRLDRSGFEAIDHGLVSTYRQARAALSAARRTPDAEHAHELRKRIKYHRYHLDLLHRMWPAPFEVFVAEAERVGELLGQHHDLDVLLAVLDLQPAKARQRGALARMRAAIEPEAMRLKSEALVLAARLLAEKPGRFRARMAAYWSAWREPN